MPARSSHIPAPVRPHTPSPGAFPIVGVEFPPGAEKSGFGESQSPGPTRQNGLGHPRVVTSAPGVNRFTNRVGLMTRDLGKAIESPRRYSFSNLPRSITWSEVERMLQKVDRRSPVGKRDYVLLVTYGWRAREVGALTLDDLDWKRAHLHIRGRKAGHSTAYPWAPTVGEALHDYLKTGATRNN